MKAKQIRWTRGRYGTVFGTRDGVRLFTIQYGLDKREYVLQSTLPGIRARHCDTEVGCADLAYALLDNFVKNLIEE